MRELSLHILDIVQNSIAADASIVKIIIHEDIKRDLFLIKISDNGNGIAEDRLDQIADPFITSRKTRGVGLGISLFKEAARRCNGDLQIESAVGQGTEVEVCFKYSHIDRSPLGDIQGTLISLISVNPDLDFIYQHKYQDKKFIFSTVQLKKELDGVSINKSKILNWIAEYLDEGLEDLYGGD